MTLVRTLTILATGPQASVQGAPRTGHRHLGVPWAGAADPLSLALANRLLGNALTAPGIEAPFGLSVRLGTDCAVAVTGADAALSVEGAPVAAHAVLLLRAGQFLVIAPPRRGARSYLAVAGGLAVPDVLGSPSTYLPAGLGGHEGRALVPGDVLTLAAPGLRAPAATPARFRPAFSGVLRAVPSAEFTWLSADAQATLFAERFAVSRLADRMGLRLDGPPLAVRPDPLPSGAVFPGTVQLPPGGAPILLGPDAQATGGYPRVAAVISADRYLYGQLRPGDAVRFYRRTPEEAARDTRAKTALWREWLGEGWSG